LDEHTGLVFDFQKGECSVSGVSSVSLVRECDPEIYATGSTFPLRDLGDFKLPEPQDVGIPSEVWEMVLTANQPEKDAPSSEVSALLKARQQARADKDWAESDRLRDEIAALGWQVQDTPDGQNLEKI
jgi:hypothetical protein